MFSPDATPAAAPAPAEIFEQTLIEGYSNLSREEEPPAKRQKLSVQGTSDVRMDNTGKVPQQVSISSSYHPQFRVYNPSLVYQQFSSYHPVAAVVSTTASHTHSCTTTQHQHKYSTTHDTQGSTSHRTIRNHVSKRIRGLVHSVQSTHSIPQKNLIQLLPGKYNLHRRH